MKRIALLLLILGVLASCQALGGDDDNDDSAGDGGGSAALVQWDRSPGHIVFRAEVTSNETEDAFFQRSEVPYCTVYGDNRVVWTVTTGDNATEIFVGRAEDAIIQRFVEDLTVGYTIYNYDAGADRQPPGDLRPVVEKLTLHVNGLRHVTDALAGWSFDYFEEITDMCRRLAAPVTFAPTGAWLSAQATEYDSNSPGILWDGQAENSIDFAPLAASGERRWIEGDLLAVLWDITNVNPPTLQFEQEEGTYHVALEIPYVTLDAPPPPEDEGDA